MIMLSTKIAAIPDFLSSRSNRSVSVFRHDAGSMAEIDIIDMARKITGANA